MAGQREDRFTHLLCGEPDMQAIEAHYQQQSTSNLNKSEENSALQERVSRLEQQVTELQQQVQSLLAQEKD
jgi:uncharacterized protein YceH (UPF0502 family)